MFAISTSKATQVSTNSLSASKMALEAQQYAAAEGDVIRMKAYTDLANSAKAPITGTHFSKEVSLGDESNYTDTIKKRIVTVKIYKDSDSLPCYTLEVPRLSADVNGKGVPIGTVITWASANNPTENGVWLECNGQSCSSYPELVKVLGSNTVPDYRGVFLRGLGSVNSTHYGNVTHQSGTLGELQGDSIRNITGWIGNCEEFSSPIDATSVGKPIDGEYHYPHDLGAFAVEKTVGGAYGGLWQIQGTGYKQTNGNSVLWSDKVQGGFNFQLNTSLVVPTSNENRPINRAIRYFIRAA